MLLTPDIVPGLVATGASARIAAEVTPRCKPGDTVPVRNDNPTTHTRIPGHLRTKFGVVEHDHGGFAPDTLAHSQGEKPQFCYSVRFAAREVWGETASARDTMRVDVIDDYMDPA